jgi:hypothetical protein
LLEVIERSNVIENVCVIFFLGLIAFALAGASFPYFYLKRQEGKNLLKQEHGLAGQSIVRGAYVNTGSKDIGPDPGKTPQ